MHLNSEQILDLCQNPPILETERLIMKPVRREYEPYISTYLGDRSVRHNMRMPTLDTAEKIDQWWQRFEDLRKKGEVVQWSAFHKETNDYVALVTVKEIVWQDLTGELGYSVLKNYWGKGYATESCMAAVNFMRNELMFESLIALILPENLASQGVVRKLGFKQDATLKDYILYEENRYDLLRFIRF